MKPLQASDLTVGRRYFSPSGKLCMLVSKSGVHSVTLMFTYFTGRERDNSFWLSAENTTAIAAMQEASTVKT